LTPMSGATVGRTGDRARETELAGHFPPSMVSQGSPPPLGAAAVDSFGARTPNVVYPSVTPKSPHLTWLNLLLIGLPQMIYGQVGKGLSLLAAAVVLAIVTAGLSALPFVIATIIDGYMVGSVLKSGRPVGKWQFFPR
jgi:hypothetical protein